MLLVRLVGEICAQLEESPICTLDVWQHVVVDTSNRVSSEHLDDHIPLASFSANAQIDKLACLDLSRINVRLHLDRLVRVQLVDVDVAARLLEFLFEFLTDRNDVAIFNKLLRELVEEFLLRHWVQTVEVTELFKPRVLPQLVVVSLVAKVDRFERDSIRVLCFEIIWEIAIQYIGEHGLVETEEKEQ